MREIKRILCPIDFSDVSQHTIDHAALVARWYGARITALHVASPVPIPVPDLVLAGEYAPPPMADERENARQQLAARFSSAAAGEFDVLVQTGPPARQIVAVAKSLPADLLVIGTHGATGFEHLLLGSVTEKVLRQSTCPVLTVPPQSRATSKLPFKRILCPIDFSDPSLAALDFAFSLAREGDADLTILHVFEWPEEPLTTRPIATPEYRQALESDVNERLANLVPEEARDWCRPITRLGHGKAYREIVGVATEDECDLIVMGIHGRNALDLMLFGSTTNQVVRRATCPVLTLRG